MTPRIKVTEALDVEKANKAFNAMKVYGISENQVKPALKELLAMYEGSWVLIEDQEYEALLECILAKNQTDDELLNSKKKKALAHIEPQGPEPLARRLRSSKKSKVASASTAHTRPKVGLAKESSSESEDCTPLVRKPRKKQTDILALVDNSKPVMMQTTQLHCSYVENDANLLSHEGHVESKCKKVDSSQNGKPLFYQRKRNPKSASSREKGKTPLMSQVVPTVGRLTSDPEAGISFCVKLEIEPNKQHMLSASELDLFHNDYSHRPGTDSFVINKPQDELPLAVIHPGHDALKRSNARGIFGEVAQSSTGAEIVEKYMFANGIMKPVVDIDDISGGEETTKISFVNEYSLEELPVFLYTSKNFVYNKASVNFTLASISDEDSCSQCFKDCLLCSIPCQCAKRTGGEFAYTPGGLLKDSFVEEFISNQRFKSPKLVFCRDCPLERSKGKYETKSCKGHLERSFIKECWSKCRCSKKCGNRVVQRGISVALQVFQTLEGKGWGLRAVEALPKGAFVCEYVGEIITNSEMHERNMQSKSGKKHVYLVPLDADWYTEGVQEDEKTLYLDSTSYGNVARFINHRCCDANLVGIPVEFESPHHHYYHFAFFTTRSIAAMEELTWDYGIEFGDNDQPVEPFKCLCGSSFCRDRDR